MLASVSRVLWCTAVLALVLVSSTLWSGPDMTSTPAAAAQSAQPACSPVHLEVANPQPGDLLFPGTLVMQGVAIDPTASAAPGVDRLQVYFDRSREAGGQLIGEVVAGQTNEGQRLDPTGFSLRARIPQASGSTSDSNTRQVLVYARSASDASEVVATIQVQLLKPISVGALTPTPTAPPVAFSVRPCAAATATPTFPPFPAAAPTPAPGGASAAEFTLSVANPDPGATVGHGNYVIQGVAFDASATSGTGIERVQVFLDPREQGGLFLGDATFGGKEAGGVFGFRLVATLPARGGGHTLTVYARSSVSGREITVSIPITLT
jgi:hypothetical protein